MCYLVLDPGISCKQSISGENDAMRTCVREDTKHDIHTLSNKTFEMKFREVWKQQLTRTLGSRDYMNHCPTQAMLL